jgi:CheY-like chemotaxis protein
MKNDVSHADSNKNKLESNIDINLQDFSKIDLNKFDLNLNQSQKIFNFKNNTFNINMNGMTRPPIKGMTQIIGSRDDVINILVADDEIFTRQSTIRILHNLSISLKIKLNIIEADDGLETLYLVYRCITQGVRISMIISDENMNFMYGSRTAEILTEIISRKRIAEIPFYLLTAYDNILIQKYISSSIRQILTKPLTKDTARILLLKAMEK